MLSPRLATITRGIDYLKLFSLAVVVWFTFLFNIERLDNDGAPLINLSNSTYAITVLIGLVLLAFPNLERLNIFLMLVLFEIFGLAGHLMEPLDIPVLVAEMVIIAITVFLMQRLSYYLQGVEEGMHAIVLTDEASHILPYDEAIKQAKMELVNLVDRPMTVIYCTLSSDDANFLNLTTAEEILNWNMEKLFVYRSRQVDLGRQIMSLTYVGDILFEYRNGIAVCLLEVDAAEAELFIYRLHRFVRKYRDLTLWTGTATYPHDSSSIEELVELATLNLKIYEPEEEDESLNEGSMTGDVRVGLEERLRIQQASAWVDKMAYQSATSRAIYRPTKQLIDWVGSFLILLALSPFLLVISVLIIINDGLPIFYAQERVGLGGKPFKMLKFRSMYRDAKPVEPIIVTLADGSTRMDWPPKTKDDPRVIPVGHRLRQWSLDELPQFINVLRGDMSLIGPRPSSWGLEKHTLLQTARLSVKPGITGLWQVSSRDTQNFDERLLWDLKYVQKLSLWLDIQILLRTVRAVIRKTGV